MAKDYSIAEARKRLPSLVRQAEAGGAIELTRRGEPVAVLISRERYAELLGERPDLWRALEIYRENHDLEELDAGSAFEDLRDRTPGREVSL